MGNLTENFDDWEFQCHHCGDVTVDPKLVEALQKLREFAREPVRIISGFRCPTHNTNCGGAKKSQHMLGTAADITIKGLTVYETLEMVRQIPEFDQGGIGLYERYGFVHCDVRDGPARWGGA